ncbi:hypothetical protein L211DRAFT_872096 [Terfezia boudieri ATCC MYA-4762]|uniref:DDE-1 domain-containing protein n=1 Tax=Terfezia boudieri ATCC MYA-4762 TaxID=1051890 RepID=A0A3N4M2C8_9PEZI|nr:hypothetical protein L211DRAFT_872096 [Terfezia boudieri ATCC MYA-4762]
MSAAARARVLLSVTKEPSPEVTLERRGLQQDYKFTIKFTMKLFHLVLCLSLFVYYVWGAPPRRRRVLQPVSLSDTNVIAHLPGTRKSIPATPRAKARQRPGPKPKSLENRVYKQVNDLKFPKEQLLSGEKIEYRLWVRKLAHDVNQMHHGCVYGHSWRLLYLSVLLRSVKLVDQYDGSISSRSITWRASKVLEEYRQLIQEWLRFNRRNSQPRNFLERDQIVTDIGCYSLSNILNLDETPIPFEYLDGRTLDFIGNKSISVKTQQSGWDKRQATLILYLFADGFIEKELIPALNPSNPSNSESESRSSLLILDAAAFHTTDDVLARGCTGLIQPLDTAVNKPFKEYLREFTNQYVEKQEKKQPSLITKGWALSDKRIMTTHVVGDAWAQFCKDKKNMICKSFRDVGITLPIDGSQVHRLQIKGIPASDFVIGNGEFPSPARTDPALDIELETFYRSIPARGDDCDAFEYTWVIEDYVHSITPPQPRDCPP